MEQSFVTRYKLLIVAGILALIALFRARPRRGPDKQLLKQMSSKDNASVLQAVTALREQGWLYDGSFHNVSLAGANLQEADLQMTNLHHAWLDHTNLQSAKLSRAKLQATDLRKANLRGTDMRGAYMQGANLRDASFDENTTLPDGTQWTPDTDMAEFTDARNPYFWKPVIPYAPPR